MSEKKILVADDSLTIQKVIRLALSGDGYTIQTVSDGKECLEQASLFRPDICIIDVSLPQFDAYQIREKFLTKPDLKNIPVILMSSAFEKVDEARAQQLGFAGHLIKPFDPSHLRSTLLSVAANAPKNDPISATINESMTDPVETRDRFPDARLNSPSRNAPEAEQEIPLIEPFNSSHITPEPSITLEPASHTQKTPSAFLDSKSPFDDFPAMNPMDDIQQLARNTFEMSGLNQHDWGMIEPGKAEVTSMDAPPSAQQDYGHSEFNTDFDPNLHGSGLGGPNSSPSSSEPFAQPPGFNSNFNQQASYNPEEVQAIVRAEVTRVLEQMQGEMQERLEHEIRAIALRQVPDLAERIIKEEIHKLLSEPPL